MPRPRRPYVHWQAEQQPTADRCSRGLTPAGLLNTQGVNIAPQICRAAKSCIQKQCPADTTVGCCLATWTLTWTHLTDLGASGPPAGLPGRSAGASPQTAGTAQTPAPCSRCTGGCPAPAPSGPSHTSLWSTRKARHREAKVISTPAEQVSWALRALVLTQPLSLPTTSEFLSI